MFSSEMLPLLNHLLDLRYNEPLMSEFSCWLESLGTKYNSFPSKIVLRTVAVLCSELTSHKKEGGLKENKNTLKNFVC